MSDFDLVRCPICTGHEYSVHIMRSAAAVRLNESFGLYSGNPPFMCAMCRMTFTDFWNKHWRIAVERQMEPHQ